jgi:benzylsuccinate CoA-transferase BbsE subunit
MTQESSQAAASPDTSLYGDIVVLDLTGSIRGMHCSKLFADYGAEVLLIEPVDGSPARQIGPFAQGRQDRETSLHFIHHNRNKKSVTLNLRSEGGQKILRDLASRADLLIEDWPVGELESLGLGYEQLHALNPRLVYVSITGFGQTGPYARFKTSNIVEDAMGGLMGITGPVDKPPTMTGAQQAEHITAVHAAFAASAALLYRDLHDVGQHVDVSAQECVASVLENAIEQYTYTSVVRKRAGSRHGTAWPCTVFPCGDGYIGMCCTQPKEAKAAALLAEDYELAEDPALENTFERRARADEFEPRLIAGYMKYGKAELFHKGQSLGCPIGMTSDARDLATDPHLNEVGFFAEFQHPVIGTYKDIAAPVYMTQTPGNRHDAAPTLGQHTDESLRRYGVSESELAALHADGTI